MKLIGLSSSHTYQKLPLIPVEEFLAAEPDHANDDENILMIARIEHERSERESLEQKRMELLKRKQKLIADNKKRKDDLANLDKELEKFIDVCSDWLSLVRDPNANYDAGCETYTEAVREERCLMELPHVTPDVYIRAQHTQRRCPSDSILPVSLEVTKTRALQARVRQFVTVDTIKQQDGTRTASWWP